MRGAAEFTFFLALAAGMHVAIAAFAPSGRSAQSAGQSGAATVTLQAAAAQVSEMVERWETPPDMADEVPSPDLSQTAIPAPKIALPPAWDTVEKPPAPIPPGPGLFIPSSDSRPIQIDTASAALPTPPVQVFDNSRIAGTRPQIRPKAPKPDPAPVAPAKTEKSKPASSATARQRASGTGGGTNAGTSRNKGAATLSPGQRQSLTAQWGAQVRNRIERGKRYPASARGASGTVQVRITVARDGTLRAVSLARSSGHRALDEAALRAVQSARRFAPAPSGLQDPSYTFTLAMRFST